MIHEQESHEDIRHRLSFLKKKEHIQQFVVLLIKAIEEKIKKEQKLQKNLNLTKTDAKKHYHRIGAFVDVLRLLKAIKKTMETEEKTITIIKH